MQISAAPLGRADARQEIEPAAPPPDAQTSISGDARHTLRVPQPLRQKIQADAHKNGRTENAEILFRVGELPALKLPPQLLRENAELKAILELTIGSS